jgi:hypothetical protein
MDDRTRNFNDWMRGVYQTASYAEKDRLPHKNKGRSRETKTSADASAKVAGYATVPSTELR